MGKAVSDKEGKATLYYGKTSQEHSLFQTQNVFRDSKMITVECITIDNFLKGDRVDVIKMDIEGAEFNALIGMRKTISKSKKLTLFVEFNPSLLEEAGVEPFDLITLLKSLGFELYLIDEDIKQLIPLGVGYILKKS